jgi:ABC-type polar amino acid transport system ATPase subunit
MDPEILSLENVTKRFGNRLVLDGVSLQVRAGELLALIGPSGGGKSTLLRCINGLTSFDAGEVRIGPHVLRAGADTRGAGRQLWRLFGMVFQDFQLFPHLTALGNVIEAPVRVLKRSRAEALARGRELLTRVGLAEQGELYPWQLSGGQKQRVAIARALAMEPRGLLCDEITSALDPELKYEVLQVLEGLRDDGMSIVMVTHEIGFARHVANRVALLAEGKVVEEGPAAEVIERPRMSRTQEFLKRVLG